MPLVHVDVLCRADRSGHPIVTALRARGLRVAVVPSDTDDAAVLGSAKAVVDITLARPDARTAVMTSGALLCTPPSRTADRIVPQHGAHVLVHDPDDERSRARFVEHLCWLLTAEPARRAMVDAAGELARHDRAHDHVPQDLSHLTTPALRPTLFPRPIPGRPTPDFLGIGAQKAGTTWLAERLSSMPGVHLPPQKELHFFDLRHDRGFEWFHDELTGDDETLLRGEITPAYAILPESDVQQIAEMFPACRVFFVVRNPVDRAWSAARMELGRVAKRHGLQLDDLPLHLFVQFVLSAEVDMKSRYTETLRRWHAHFGPDNVHLVFHDDIAQRPAQVLADLQTFLGLPATEDPRATDVVFAGRPLAMPAEIESMLRRLYEPEVRSLEAVAGRDLSHWIKPGRNERRSVSEVLAAG